MFLNFRSLGKEQLQWSNGVINPKTYGEVCRKGIRFQHFYKEVRKKSIGEKTKNE
jgi:hypothetical protein